MTKPTPRRFEHVQKEKPKAEIPVLEKADVAAAITAHPEVRPLEEEPVPRLDPVMARKYWLAIILWAVAFALMIFYEVIAAIFRR